MTCNGWSNRPTWLVNLWFNPETKSDLDMIKDDLESQVDAMPNGFLKDLIDLSAINWQELQDSLEEEEEEEEEPEDPFHVVGIDENDGSATILAEFDNSGQARQWLTDYTRRLDPEGTAGGWHFIQVLDTRGECAETLYKWEKAE